MRHSNSMPEVNAGSMADIAFLLLIFFLVTATIPNDEGINRKLPRDCPPGIDCTSPINERNILRIVINNNDEIMVNNDIIKLNELKTKVKDFIDNNGDGSCSYCQGTQSESLSDNPKKAVVSLQNGKETSYNQFIAVQDQLTLAYYELRNSYGLHVLKKSPLNYSQIDLKQIKEAYPFILSEAITK